MERFLGWLKKYFIPHEENDHKPHFFRAQSILVVFLAVIIIELCFLAQVFLVFDKTKFLAAVLPGVLTSLTNEQRADNAVGPLTESDLLTRAAQMKAEDMAAKGYFAHVSPEGRTPWYWFGQVGYRYSHAGENLAVNFFESADVAQAWMDSPTHRANIVKPNFTEIGIGVANGVYQGRDTVFVAQLFGTPIKTIPIQSPTQTVSPQTAQAPAPAPAPKVATTPVTPVSAPTPAPIVPASPAPTPLGTGILGELTDSPVVSTEVTPRSGEVKMFIEKALSSPRQSATYTYIIIAVFIILALLLAIFVKSEIQHPPVIFRGLGLVAVIVLLTIVNIRFLNLSTEIPLESASTSITASAIAN